MTKLRQVKLEPAGFPTYDKILGGGEARGVVIEHWGEPGCGKTSFRLQQAGLYLARKEKVIWYDTEHCLPTLPVEYLKTLGVNPEDKNFIYIEPTKGSHAEDLDKIITRLEKEKIGLIIIDSVAQLDLNAERGMDKKEQAALAKDLKRFLRKMLDLLAEKDTTLIIVNQITTEMSKHGYTAKVTPGGYNPKFITWARVYFCKPHPVDAKGKEISMELEKAVGFNVKVIVKKARGGRPHLETTLRFYYDKGFNKLYDTMQHKIKMGEIVRAGAFYAIGKQKFQGQEKMLKYLEKNNDTK